MRVNYFHCVLFILQIFTVFIGLHAPTVPGQCGDLGNCDFLVSTSIFQVGTCGRAARCYWELRHLKIHLDGVDNATANDNYTPKIKKALCGIPTYKMYKSYVKRDPYSIFEEGMPKNDSVYDDYPMPTQYVDGDDNILPGIKMCIKMEVECSQELDMSITSLCSELMTRDNINRVELGFTLKLKDNKSFYQVAEANDAGDDTNKCALKVLTRHLDPDTLEYKVDHTFNSIHKRLRPPYFDLSILYFLKNSDNPGGNWWNESKAYSELAGYLPKPMVHSIHTAIKHIYDTRANLLDHNHNLKVALEWKPEKFCGYSSTFICVDETVINIEGAECSMYTTTGGNGLTPAPTDPSTSSEEPDITTIAPTTIAPDSTTA